MLKHDLGVTTVSAFHGLSEHDRNVLGVALYRLENDKLAAGSTRDRAKALRAAIAAGVKVLQAKQSTDAIRATWLADVDCFDRALRDLTSGVGIPVGSKPE